MKSFLLALLLISSAAGQRPSGSSADSVDERIAILKTTLEPYNALRMALEQGERGDGVHRAWMDTMKRFGIQQVSFAVRFVWHDGVKSLKVSKVRYLQHYYRYDTQLRDKQFLQQICTAGLETELRNAILIRAKDNVPNLMENVAQTANARPHRAHGTLYLNLLDDEALPVLDEMPTIDW